MSPRRERRPPSRWGAAYLGVWLGGVTLLNVHALFVTHGWERVVTVVLLVGLVVALAMAERDRRRRARQPAPDPATRE